MSKNPFPADRARGRIAIIGMSCQLPGAIDADAYWQNLRDGVDSIREIPPQRWSLDDHYSADPEAPGRGISKWGGFIDRADEFDAGYFNISPREAQYVDPQQRLILQATVGCLEDAGYPESSVSGSRTGVYIGASLIDHWPFLRESGQTVTPYWSTGCAMSLIANRISHQFNLNGPSMAVDTACSSALVALHQAAVALRAGDCDMALVGGVSVLSTPTHFTTFSKMGMLSPQGRCRTFDAQANGYVRGEGVAIVLLKREEEALADGDRILGIVLGSATNHGGRARNLTSPNAFSQARVIVDAHLQAGVPPDTIGHVEAHGTGTPLGDPIEMVGLKRAFAKLAEHHGVTLHEGTCAVGSAKPYVGHLEPVAGMAGLFKVLLSLRHQRLPGLLHFERLNPRIELKGSPFFMLDQPRDWPAGDAPRRAGLSSFGFGGANVHVVLEEAPKPPAREAQERPAWLVCLSAKTPEALQRREEQLLDWLQAAGRDVSLADLSVTLLTGRQAFDVRSAFVARDLDEVRATLAGREGMAPRRSNDPGNAAADAKRMAPESPAAAFLAALRDGVVAMDDAAYRAGLEALAEAFCAGADIDPELLARDIGGRRIALPTYPFERRRYSIHAAPGEPIPDRPAYVALETPAVAAERQAPRPASATTSRRVTLRPLASAPCATSSVHPVDTPAPLPLAAEPAPPVQLAQTPAAHSPDKGELTPPQACDATPSIETLRRQLAASLAAALYVSPESVDPARPFVELGLDSVVGVEWMRDVNRSHGLSLPVTKLYDHPTVDALARFVQAEMAQARPSEVSSAGAPTIAPPLALGTVREHLRTSLATALYTDVSAIADDRPFVDLGLDSVVGVEWIRAINKRWGTSLPATKLYDHPTVADLAAVVAAQVAPVSPPPEPLRAGAPFGLVVSTVQRLDELALTAWPLSPPAPGEVTIQVHASAINFPDLLCVQGLYPTLPPYPFVPGFEVAGVVTSVGTGVSGVAVGDEVIAVTGRTLGGHASHVNVDARQVCAKPRNLGFEEACSLPVVFSTVQQAFETARLAPGDHVLVQTATGGCGLAALQMAWRLGCVCYGTSSQEDKLEILRRLGVGHAINYRTTAFDAEIARLTNGRGVDVVLNMLSGDAIQRGLDCLAPAGRYVEIAVHALRTSAKLDLSRLVDNQSVHSIDLRRRLLDGAVEWRTSFAPLLPLFESGELRPVVSRIYPVARIAEALRYVTEARHIGKVVISHTATEVEDRSEACIQALLAQHETCRHAGIPRAAPEPTRTAPSGTDIAVIGMSGQFPMAGDLDTFWRHLREGRDCVSEVPPDRWSLAAHFDGSGRIAGKTYCRSMGALEDADRFDPLFFSISPTEASCMDPEQRLFLQNAWHCLEDAGIPPSSLAGTRCGLFAGCASGDYGLALGADRLTAHGLMGGAASILAGRVSYLLDLQGPCLSIDTACSSSLAAIATACDSLVQGSSDLALAGGAYVMASPAMHIMASQAGMLSRTGRCHTFDQSADGFVPGEGVGVVLLKRLSDALRDDDRILGVIKGWGVRQDGKTNGITAPSVNSQVALEREVYERFGVDPDRISLVEAHGTGTKLGDPIEVEALTRSFRASTPRKGYCAIGSVKSNIGHALTAAGVSGLIKLLLCLEHRTLVPSALFETPNEHIDFEGSPFYVNTQRREWPQPPNGARRLAAISSFGFSGTNVHMVIEEGPRPAPASAPDGNSALVVLSARNEAALAAGVARLRDHVHATPDLDLHDLAYTLQVGREAMERRLSFVVASRSELLATLDRLAATGAPIGTPAGTAHPWIAGFASDPDARALLATWCRKQELDRLAELWRHGVNIDWSLLHAGRRRRRIRLPGYAFARERYWLLDATTPAASPAPEATSAPAHPLMQRTVPAASGRRFEAAFNGREFFLDDHRVGGRRVLPAVAHLELARAAAMTSLPSGQAAAARRLVLQDMRWLKPVIASDAGVAIGLVLEDAQGDATSFRVESASSGGTPTVYATGVMRWMDAPPSAHLDLPALRAACDQGTLEADDCYAAFSAAGLSYGPGHRALESVHRGTDGVLARLRLPAALAPDAGGFVLHPSLMDGALQACIGLLGDSQGALPKVALPCALRELQVLVAGPTPTWSWLRRAASGSAADETVIDVDLCDDDGRVLVRMQGLALRPLVAALQAPEAKEPPLALLRSDWQPAVGEPVASSADLPSTHLVLLCGLPALDPQVVSLHLPRARCVALPFDDQSVAAGYTGVVSATLAELQRVLAQAPDTPSLVQVVHPVQGDAALVAGIAGLLKSARLERPSFSGQVIGVDVAARPVQVAALLEADARTADERIRHLGTRREVLHWSTATQADALEAPATPPWKPQGVYLITGGAGGIGLVFAQEIVRRMPTAHVVLAGRSLLSEAQRTRLDALIEAGGSVEYQRLDVTDEAAVRALVNDIAWRRGRLDGIVHAAGVVRDAWLRGKDTADAIEVLAPKVAGLVHLDQASRHLDIDFLAAFSSMAGVLGNAGQGDYAAANGFLDAWMAMRAARVARGEAHGRSLSIAWPLWEGVGMGVDPATAQRIRSRIGCVTPVSGVAAFCHALALPDSVVAVTSATPEALTTPTARPAAARIAAAPLDSEGVRAFVVDTLMRVLKLPAGALDDRTPFEKYGVDSIVQATLVQEMEARFGELPKTLLFEHPTLGELVTHLVQRGVAFEDMAPMPADEATEPHGTSTVAGIAPTSGDSDIAIIGFSGRYPKSATIDALWQNLLEGRNCVTRAPSGRWEPGDEHGGFLDGIDRFDHRLFGIDLGDVERMTPELRLFLEIAWETFANAGYARPRLQALQDREALGIGVFVGSMYSQYGAAFSSRDEIVMQSNESDWQLANRVSHSFDLRGPSIAVNTACASSLTAIHLACESLRQGSCAMALAGGVNLTLDRSKYLRLRDVRMLDEGPHSRSLGMGDGYVPGEGVGAVLLKPLAAALRDGDRIDGILRASFVNHAGGRQKYTVPDPKRQGELVAAALSRANVDIDTIGYVETAANGSPLGDPIEIVALNQAFRRAGRRMAGCAIGAVKSNLGHLEAASGISQLTKVLLQLRHRTLVPTLHADPQNPALPLSDGPFHIQHDVAPWPAPGVADGGTRAVPRRALVNSFGAGGAYACAVVEEAPSLPGSAESPPPLAGWPCVVSAATPGSLRRWAGALHEHLSARPTLSLADIACTLDRVDNNLPHRLVLVASSLVELQQQLAAVRDGRGASVPGVLLPETANDIVVGGDGLLAQLARWVAGERATRDGLTALPARPPLPLPPYAFDHDHSFRAASASPSTVQPADDHLQAIFERIAQGALSMDRAWNLLQTTEG